MVINPILYERVPFDPYKNFDPVTVAVTSPDILSVNPSLPVQSVKDLVRLSLGLDLVHIPFNSAGLAIGSTVAGHTPIAFTTPPPVVPQVKEGKLRPLAVASKTRAFC